MKRLEKLKEENIDPADLKANLLDLIEGLDEENFEDRWEVMVQLVRNTERIESEDANFDIEINSEDEIILRLVREDGEEFVLNRLLPQGFGFREGDGYEVDEKEKEVVFPPGDKKYRGFLLSLFHEIGHTYAENPKLMEDVGELIKTLKLIGKSTVRRSKEGIGLLKALGKMKRYPESQAIEGDDIKSFVKSEKDSWAFALREIRNLENQGFDVFADFKNVDDIEGFILGNLVSYEMGRRLWKKNN